MSRYTTKLRNIQEANMRLEDRFLNEQKEAGAETQGPEKATTNKKTLPFITDQNKAQFLKFTNNVESPLATIELVNKLTSGKYNKTVENYKAFTTGGDKYDENGQLKPGIEFTESLHQAIKNALQSAVDYGLDPNNKGALAGVLDSLNRGAAKSVDKSGKARTTVDPNTGKQTPVQKVTNFAEGNQILPIYTQIFNKQKVAVSKV